MHPTGHVEVERAQKDGRWDAAYDSPKNMKLPIEFLEALAKNKKAAASWKTLSKAKTYVIAWQLHDAKRPETKKRRITRFVAMLARGEMLR